MLRWSPDSPGSHDLAGYTPGKKGARPVARVLRRSDGTETWRAASLCRIGLPGRFETRDDAVAAAEAAWSLVPTPYEPWPGPPKRWRLVPNRPR